VAEQGPYEHDIASRTATGLRSVLAGAVPKFQLEYRCDAPHEQRWFLLTVTQFPGAGPIRAVVSHENVTPLKRAEAHAVHQSAQLVEAFNGAVDAIALLAEARDPYTAGHQHRVAALAGTIAVALGLEDDQRTGLRLGATMHDIGKISIPAEILVRPGRLSDLEIQIMRQHPQTGFDVLHRVSFPWPIAEMVAQHHERLDGSGYPYGLVGEQICLEARIIAVADVFDAMSSHRPYRPALGMDESVATLLAGRGIGLDADAVDALLLHLSAQPATVADAV
jgi:putative nucleotidyltransferase with HDIG domain